MKFPVLTLDILAKYLRYSWYYRLLAFTHSFDITPVKRAASDLAASSHVCFCIICNDRDRLPFFLEYYRAVGIQHFLFVDNGSSDGSGDYLTEQPDCTVYRAPSLATYRKSLYGTHWANHLARKYLCGKWVLYIDVNEFLVYPHIETRNIRALTTYLEGMRRLSFNTMVLDCYSRTPFTDLPYQGGNPIDQCPYFDQFGYVNFQDWFYGQKIVGGLEKRTLYAHAPKLVPPLQRTPLIKWEAKFRFVDRAHILYPRHLNRCHRRTMTFATGCLLRFKYFTDLQEKLEKERMRFDPVEAEALRLCFSRGETVFWNESSCRYDGWRSLLESKLLGTGNWF